MWGTTPRQENFMVSLTYSTRKEKSKTAGYFPFSSLIVNGLKKAKENAILTQKYQPFNLTEIKLSYATGVCESMPSLPRIKCYRNFRWHDWKNSIWQVDICFSMLAFIRKPLSVSPGEARGSSPWWTDHSIYRSSIDSETTVPTEAHIRQWYREGRIMVSPGLLVSWLLKQEIVLYYLGGLKVILQFFHEKIVFLRIRQEKDLASHGCLWVAKEGIQPLKPGKCRKTDLVRVSPEVTRNLLISD